MTSNKKYWDVTKTPLGKWWLTNESGWLCKWFCFNLMRELLFLTIVSKVTSAQFTPECIVGWLASGVAEILFFFWGLSKQTHPTFCTQPEVVVSFRWFWCLLCVCVSPLNRHNHIFQTRYPNSGGNDWGPYASVSLL